MMNLRTKVIVNSRDVKWMNMSYGKYEQTLIDAMSEAYTDSTLNVDIFPNNHQMDL